MKNNKLVNIIISISIVLLIASLILMLTKTKKVENHITEITYQEYTELLKKDEVSIILLTSPTCDHCKDYKPYVNYVLDENGLTAYELSLSTLTYDEYIEIHDKYSSTKDKYSKDNVPSILTPATILVKNNEEVTSVLGNIGYSGFSKLLKQYEIIK